MKIVQILIPLLATTPLLANPTDPVGVVNSEIPAHDGGAATFKILSLSLLNERIAFGTVDSVSGSTINLASASLTAGEFAQTDSFGNSLFYVEMTSGVSLGLSISIVSNTDSTVVLSEDLSAGVSPGDSFNIRRFTTVSQFFGADNSEYSLEPATNADLADSLYLPQPDGSFQRIFYQNAPPFAGGTGWRAVGDASTDRADAIIFNDAVLIGRFGPTARPAFSVANVGEVKVVDQRNPILPGSNTLTYAFPVSRNLAQLGFNPSDLVQGTNADSADNLYIVSNGQFVRYYYQNAPAFAGGSGWRVPGDSTTDQGPIVDINPGDGILFIRRGLTPFNWTASKPSGI